METLETLESTDGVQNTATDEAQPAAEGSTSTHGVTSEPRTYRVYGIIKEDGTYASAGGDKVIIAAETADGKRWKSAEENKNTVLNEVQFTFYSVESIDGFKELVPDAEQQIYLINRGLSTLQTSKANQLVSEVDEQSKEFKYSGVNFDLRDVINETPKRQSMTDTQKILKQVSALDPEEVAKLMAALAAMQA